MADQSFSNHAKFVPTFHYLSFPAAVFVVGVLAKQLLDDVSLLNAASLLLALVALSALLHARVFALGVQDRVIRLEERLRLQTLLDEPLRGRIGALTTSQLIGLRFAPDAEVPGLVERVLAGELTSSKAIKAAVQSWRADHQRI